MYGLREMIQSGLMQVFHIEFLKQKDAGDIEDVVDWQRLFKRKKQAVFSSFRSIKM